MGRKTRERYFLSIAKVVAQQSTCDRASVGAVLVDPRNNRIISTGFNGSVPGAKHCDDGGCVMEDGHCRTTVHAEMNALLFKVGYYEDLHLFCTTKPCYQCIKALITSNVSYIYYISDYDDPIRESLLANISEVKRPKLIRIELDE